MAKPKVAVFGAGVAGLTVAHELALRGAEVTVYEREPVESIGGKACSQRAPYLVPSTGATITLPGEHGFRFFPSFYRHLTDTMRRIPFWPRGAPVGTSGPHDALVRCADNLVPTYTQAFAAKVDGENRMEVYEFERRLPRSIEAVTRAALQLLSRFGYSPRDLARYQLKLFQYATSSARRRGEQYERLSWWDFLDADQFSPIFQKHVNSVPRVLVAMDAKTCDARTQGNVTIQLLADYLAAGEDTDRTLNGPTTERWLMPWFRFLRDDLGVHFRFRHAVIGLELDGAGRLLARVNDEAVGAEFTIADAVDYVVLALPLGATRELVAPLDAGAVATYHAADFDELNQLAGWVTTPNAKPELTWMSGVQFYFDEDIPILPGHIYFPDSPWGLSLVSQGQFWGGDFPTRFGGGVVRGLISVDIAEWDRPAGTLAGEPASGRSARACTREEVILEVWFQLTQALADLRGVRGFPLPQSYLFANLDQALPYDASGAIPAGAEFHEEMTVTTPASWVARPGDLILRGAGGAPGEWRRPGREELRRGYPVRLGKLLFAGEHTQTYTGLPTMEGANEAARHAVNGIIDHLEARYNATTSPGDPALNLERCEIWNLEESEPGDLDFFKLLDEKLIAQALGGAAAPIDPRRYPPHFLEILGFEDLVDLVLDNSSGLVAAGDRIIDLLSAQLSALNLVKSLFP